jgi:hypothetical protein
MAMETVKFHLLFKSLNVFITVLPLFALGNERNAVVFWKCYERKKIIIIIKKHLSQWLWPVDFVFLSKSMFHSSTATEFPTKSVSDYLEQHLAKETMNVQSVPVGRSATV